ncbi:MAG: acyltransferase [Planctomycetota bacterium]
MTDPTIAADDPDHARFRATRHFGSLDGLRAFSILAVLWHHGLSRQGEVEGLASRGYHGVGLFFAISGFLISTLLLRERESRGRIDFRAFFMRRALRIFPLYYAVLLAHVVLVPLVHGDDPRGALFFENLPRHAVYLSNWCENDSFGHAWSLACEEQFYLVWPWVLILLAGWRPLAGVLGLWATKFAVARAVEARDLDPDGFLVRLLANVPDAILAGIVAAFLLHGGRSHRICRVVLGARVAPLLAGVLVVLVLASRWHDESYAILPVAFAILVASVVIREDHLARPLLGAPPLRHLGRVSYGVYLVHIMVLAAVARGAGEFLPPASAGRFAVALGASWLVAAISFRWFERPFLELKSRFRPRGRVAA